MVGNRLFIVLLLLGVLGSCSSPKWLVNENPLKLIAGEIFPEAQTQLTFSRVEIRVKGEENERFTTPHLLTGEFEILVREGEVLIVRYMDLLYTEVLITEDNTYFIHLTENKGRSKPGRIPH